MALTTRLKLRGWRLASWASAALLAALGGTAPGAARAGQFAVEQKNVRFERISLEQGLSQAFVNGILQDREGFMWFGTQEGLNRFDGYEFKVLSHNPDEPGSLSHNMVKSILEDRQGLLWIGTDGGGLNRLDPRSGTFTHFRTDPADPASLSHDRVFVVYEDRSGTIWAGTDGGGLNRYEPDREGFTRFLPDPADPAALSDGHIRDLVEDSAGTLWIATEGGGLNAFDRETGRFSRYRFDAAREGSLSDDRVRSLLVARDGHLWVGTYDGGLNRFDRRTGLFRHFKHDPDNPASLASNQIRAIYQDRRGGLWIGTEGGLQEWLPESGGFALYRHDPTDPYSLSHDRVIAIYEDSGGILWVSTYGGLNKWNTATASFLHFKHGALGAQQISNDYVTSFAEDPDGSIWVGTYGGGLNRLDRTTGRTRHIGHLENDPRSLSDDRVMALHVDRQGVLWVGTRSGGLNRLDPGSGRFTRFVHDPENPASLSMNGVTSIREGRGGSLWIGTIRGGLNRLDRGSGRFTRYFHDPEDPTSLSSNRVLRVFVDRAGTLWIGTLGGGLNRYEPDSDSFTAFRNDPSDPASLSHDEAWSIEEDVAGDLWIATQGGGINRWSAADRRDGRAVFRHYSRRDGLITNQIYGVVADSTGALWLSSNRGLTRFDPLADELRHFDTSHGLQSNEFNFGAEFRTRDGRMLFGGINGFNLFDPKRLPRNTHVPPVVITRFLKFNQATELERPFSEVTALDLGFRDYVVAFEFAALDFAAPEKNRYMHMLEGFDKDWVDLGHLRRATYTNLEPGSYTFRVRASNNDGVWNERGVSLKVTVAPPPWSTWWAYGLYTLLAGSVVLAFAQSQARKRQRAEELASTNLSLEEEISRRQAKEEALEREKSKAQKYLDVAEVIMLVTDQEGRVALINQKGCRVLGCREPEIVGKSWVDHFVPPRHREMVRGRLARIDRHDSYESSVLTHDGEERTIAWHTAVLPGDDGSQSGLLSSGTDVTDERELRREKEWAESANRAKSQFLANMSHEIRTPLHGLLGMTELLLGSDLDPRQRRFAETARRSAQNLLGILNDILDFSKIEAGKLELEAIDFDLIELVDEVCHLFAEPANSKSLELVCRVEPDVPATVSGDPTRLRQVLSNLIGNAVKFTEVGEIEVRVRSLAAKPGRSRLRCEVRDTGVGLEPGIMDSIFKSFQQADGSTTRKYGGTGLGLAISKELVEMMGGEIGVESSPGAGSTFWFELPLALAAGAAETSPRPADAKESETSGRPRPLPAVDRRPRILVAEDNPVNQDLACTMLEELGAEVEVARDGSEALSAALRGGLDLIFMDCHMPVMDGFDATRRIRLELGADGPSGPRAQAPRLPIIAMTANAMARDRERCLAAGMDDFLSKPFGLEQLGDCLARWLPRAVAEPGARPRTPLDRSALDNIRALQPDRALDLLRRVVRSYFESSPKLVGDLRRAVHDGDAELMGAAAHSLKSSSATLGATELAALCQALESLAGTNKDLARAGDLLSELENEFERVKQALLAECPEACAA